MAHSFFAVVHRDNSWGAVNSWESNGDLFWIFPLAELMIRKTLHVLVIWKKLMKTSAFENVRLLFSFHFVGVRFVNM